MGKRKLETYSCQLIYYSVTFSESKRFLGDFKLNGFKFGSIFKDPDNPADKGFMLKDIELEISNGPVDGFRTSLDTEFKTNYLKFMRSLHSLSPSGCPNISYDDYISNTFLNVFDLTASGVSYQP